MSVKKKTVRLKTKRKIIWKDIPGYEGLYKINNMGDVKSLKREVKHWKGGTQIIQERILKQILRKSDGYFEVSLYNNGVMKSFRVHQLLAMAFHNHTPCGYKKVVDHKNNIKTDNRAANIRIVTARENSDHKHIKSSSKYTGVFWHKNKWQAKIYINGKSKYLGRYDIEEKAAEAYNNELLKITNN